MTPKQIAHNVVHRAHQFVGSKQLKGAETYMLNRFNETSLMHPCHKDPRTFMQSWLFDFLTKRQTRTTKP
jgi:hypothetical protein